MAILLHQSGVLFGVNLSLADIFCMAITVVLLLQSRLHFPITATVFFLIVSIIIFITANFVVPIQFQYSPSLSSVLTNYIKFFACFIYFLVGYNLFILERIESVIKYYSLFGICIGFVGVVFTFLHLPFFRDLLFFADVRFRGLMIDPNYFSVLQLTALVYFLRANEINPRVKSIAMIIIPLSVLISGSKTGMITLFLYLLFVFFGYLISSNKKATTILYQLIFISLMVLIMPIVMSFFQKMAIEIFSSIPSLERVQYLFVDFQNAISESGSERDDVWMAALGLIQLSPLFGIGIGTYIDLAWMKFGVDNVAHNSYLQFLAEWGIPITVVFFSYMIYLLFTVTKIRNISNYSLILRDMIIILLIGSLAVSLNNARILWLILGALVALLMFYKHSSSGGSYDV